MMASKFPSYSIMAGVMKGAITSGLKKRSEKDLRNDIESVIAMLNKCLEEEVEPDNTGHIS